MSYFIIRVADILPEGCDFTADTTGDAWFKGMVAEVVQGEAKSFEASLSARVLRLGRSVEITGGVYLKTDVACSRCLENFGLEQQIPFRFILEPRPAVESESNWDEDLNDSLDFSYYDGDDIDIGDLIRQHLLMAMPISRVCNEMCRGLCPQCGRNMNKGGCKCQPEAPLTPFSILKSLETPGLTNSQISSSSRRHSRQKKRK